MDLPAPDADLPLPALIDAAWAEHLRQPARLARRGEHLVARAAPGSAEAGWGWLTWARGHRFFGRGAEGDAALAQAEAIFAALPAEAGLAGRAACDEQRAFVRGMQGHWDEAQALLAATGALAPALRRPWERFQGHLRRAWVHDMRGDRDASLRERYAHLACAHETGDSAAVGYVLGLLAGVHADLFNLEEADRLGAQAVQQTEAAGAFAAWTLAALNHLNALVALGRGGEGLPLAERLLACDADQPMAGREQRRVLYADVMLQAGQVARAQALLDESVALRHGGSRSLASHATVQVAAALAAGDAARARAVGEAYLAAPDPGTDPAQLPTERLRLLRMLSQACEQLGDAGAALRHERQAFDVHDQLVGRSARARRLALAIEHELDRERWQRARAEAERERLDAANRALEAAQAAKTRFLAAASHDLRQPVQAMALALASLEIEARQVGHPALHELVNRISGSLQALTQLFDVLLDVSRLDAGIVPVHLQPMPLTPLLTRLCDELAPVAAARGLRLALRLPRCAAGAQPATCSDAVLLERSLRNLLDNALKYTAAGGVLLALRRRGAGWAVEVHDSGIGMTPEVLARACEEFFQADNPERDRRRGLGLGLSLVQRTLRLMGHELQLHSRAGRGTTARVALPGCAPPAAASADPAPGLDAAPSSGVLVVVDDDLAVREGLVGLLQRWGHRVLAGVDDRSALAAWQSAGQPAVQAVVTDLRLARHRTGLEVVAALRRAWGDALPALVITGDIAPDRLEQLRESGLPWLAKPVSPLRLRSWLQSLPAPE